MTQTEPLYTILLISMVLASYMIHSNTYKTDDTRHAFALNSILLLMAFGFMGSVYAKHVYRPYIYGCLAGLFVSTEVYFYYYQSPNPAILEDDAVTAIILLGWVGLMALIYNDTRVRAVAMITAVSTVLTLHYLVPMYHQKAFDHVLYMGILWLWMIFIAYEQSLSTKHYD